MNHKEIEKLIETFANQQISKLSIKKEDFEILLEKHIQCPTTITTSAIAPMPIQQSQAESVAPAPQPQAAPQATDGTFIISPMVGTFYRAPSPDSPPYVNVGDKIKKGQIIGIVEAMKIMNEIEAEFDCQIVEIIASDAQPVEFNSKLIKVEKI
ncbi:acetyl-CoA carboxylase, biotin carboxyl carrier protein [Helicobacter enhydrae]|uniref:Biotin carboxyl carrier protein of acetyl-CoA carboxylase n=1 Tax=Helicobacter enhydrae TaxID=222136 RepID=A0A1B1U6X6_9HELI|nr:acetyl-CoA carboxylase biotin carboxyl carrier protein [Helicobacter enhydrae]ANV98544.1 acetyl-CoA carboxylase, biotin carboxyl carrier protein [Helicobacter enhydrae]